MDERKNDSISTKSDRREQRGEERECQGGCTVNLRRREMEVTK